MTAFIKLETTLESGSDLTTLVDYRAAITEDSSCVGVWIFDENYCTVVGGNVTQIDNWKSGGTALAQATTNQQGVLGFDTTLNVGYLDMDNDANVLLRKEYGGVTISPMQTLTFVVVFQTSAADPFIGAHIMGMQNGTSTTDRISLRDSFTGGLVPRVDFEVGSARGLGNVVFESRAASVGKWVSCMASFNGVDSTTIRTNKDTANTTTSLTPGTPTVNTFTIGKNNGLAFNGKIAIAMAFTSDLFDAGKSALKASVEAFLDARFGRNINP